MEKSSAIQAFRAIAAWSVVLGHAGILSIAVAGGSEASLFVRSITDRFAHLGVDMFFVISGAIMFWVTYSRRNNNRWNHLGTFLWRRVLRIYPLFWITLIVSASVGAGPWPASAGEWLASLTLWVMPPAHPVSWTLFFEVRFYLVVSALIVLAGAAVGSAFAVWAAALGIAVFLATNGIIPWTPFYIPIILEFAMGALVGALVLHRVQIAPVAFVIVGAAALVATCVLVFPRAPVDDFRLYGYGLPSALLLYGVLSLEKQGHIRTPQWLVAQGDASYSIYLWHFTILWFLRTWWPIGTGWAIAYALAAFALTAGVAYLSYRFIERPLMQLRWPKRARPTDAASSLRAV